MADDNVPNNPIPAFDGDTDHLLDGGSAPRAAYRPFDGGSSPFPLAAYVASSGGEPGDPADVGPLPMAEPLDDQEVGRIPIVSNVAYPEAAWDPVLLAQLILGDFGGTAWQAIKVPEPSRNADDLLDQIATLIDLRELRAQRLGEIVAQAQDFTRYFANVLMINPKSHPNCWTVLAAAQAIGHMIGMHFKKIYDFPRPVQVYPALMTAIPTPPHPSYPNVHALQSRLVAMCFSEFAPDLRWPLGLLADRIAENRAIAGLHYVADKIGSIALAEGAFDLLKDLPRYIKLRQAATDELGAIRWTVGYLPRNAKTALQDTSAPKEQAGPPVCGVRKNLPGPFRLSTPGPWRVRNQGARVTCVAFSVTACVEFQLCKPKKPVRLSEEFLHWAAFKMSQAAARPGGVIRLEDAMNALEVNGIALAEDWGYDLNADPTLPPPTPDEAAKTDASQRKFNLGTYLQLKDNPNAMDRTLVAKTIAGLMYDNQQPVAICIPIFQEPNLTTSGWDNQEARYYGDVTDPSPLAMNAGSHCICLLGWLPDKCEASGGYFIFRNSWGSDWASRAPSAWDTAVPYPGYGKISATYVNTWCLEFLQVGDQM